MNIIRGIVRWIVALAIGTAVSTWVLLATVNATIANRNVVKNWLAQSGVYNKTLSSLLQVSAGSGQSGDTIITPDILQIAFTQTFNSAYVQQGVNKVLDGTYDWVEGKKSAITFTIPVQEKAPDFAANLAALVQPKLEALPRCTSRLTHIDTLTCLPVGVSAADYAKQLTTQPSGDSNFLQAPITEQWFKQPGFPQLGWLPMAMQWLHLLVLGLPVTLLALGGIYVLVNEDKLRGTGRFGRQLTINAGITLVSGLFLWYASTSIDLTNAIESGDKKQAAIVSTLVNPLARTVLPDVGKALSLYSGVVVAIGGSLWLSMFVWRHRRGSGAHKDTHVPPPDHNTPEVQVPPAMPVA